MMYKHRWRYVLGIVVAGVVVWTLVVGGTGGRIVPVPQAPMDSPWFQEVSSNRIHIEGNASGDGEYGVYVIDANMDGWSDVLFVDAGTPRLLMNRNGSFYANDRAVPDVQLQAAIAADFTHDRREDLLFLPKTGAAMLLENVDDSFSVKGRYGPDLGDGVSGATTADYDRDGCRDVLIARTGNWHEQMPVGHGRPPSYVLTRSDNGRQNLLLEGNCSGFSGAQVMPGSRWSLAASFTDFTGDGWPDVHVANDVNRDRLYVNQGGDTFKATDLGPHTNRNGMSSEVADVNEDGRPDIFITNIRTALPPWMDKVTPFWAGDPRHEGNNLLVNTGNGLFVDRAPSYGVARGGVGWAAIIADFDNDMDQDLFHTTLHGWFIGIPQPLKSLLHHIYPSYYFPRFWERTGPSRFRPRSAARLGFEPADAESAAALDFDRDGDMDIAVADKEDGLKLYQNQGSNGNWLQLQIGGSDRPHALGAEVRVVVGGRTQYFTVKDGADHLSQDTRIIHAGLGEHGVVDMITVTWPNGDNRTLRDVPTNQRIAVAPP